MQVPSPSSSAQWVCIDRVSQIEMQILHVIDRGSTGALHTTAWPWIELVLPMAHIPDKTARMSFVIRNGSKCQRVRPHDAVTFGAHIRFRFRDLLKLWKNCNDFSKRWITFNAQSTWMTRAAAMVKSKPHLTPCSRCDDPLRLVWMPTYPSLCAVLNRSCSSVVVMGCHL